MITSLKFKENINKLSKVKKKEYHPLIHKLNKKYNISRKTLFYIKEYGRHKNVFFVIFKESIKLLILASIISTFGGIALEYIKNIFIAIMPLIIILPVLNDMIGDYGTIVSSRFSTMLHQGKINGKASKNEEVKRLFVQILIISLFTAFFSSALSLIISHLSNHSVNFGIAYKVFAIAIIDTLILVTLIFLTAITAGLYFYKKKEDPNNFLIPITTSVADFGNIVIMSILISLFF